MLRLKTSGKAEQTTTDEKILAPTLDAGVSWWLAFIQLPFLNMKKQAVIGK